MSLVNEYLKKTAENAPDLSQAGAVPPILTSSPRKGVKKRNTRLILIGVVAALGIVAVYQVGSHIYQAFSPSIIKETVQVAGGGEGKKEEIGPVAVNEPQSGMESKAEDSEVMAKATSVETKNLIADAGSPEAGKPRELYVAAPAQVKAAPAEVPVPVKEEPRLTAYRFRPEVAEPERETLSPVPGSNAASPITISSRKINNSQAAVETEKRKPVEAMAGSGIQPIGKRVEQYYQMGLVAQRDGDFDQAEKHYQSGLRLDPTNVKLLTNLSAVYIRTARYEQAVESLERARRVDPGNSKILVNMGNIDLIQKNYSSAKTNFKNAVILNPSDETALINLAYLAQLESNLPEMEEYYQRIIKINPGNVDVLLAYASVLEQTGRYAEALIVYEQSLELDAVKRDRRLTGRIRERSRYVSGFSRTKEKTSEP